MNTNNISNFQHAKLSAYLATASVFILMHDHANTQIIYNNISPDAELGDINDFMNLDLDENGDLDFAFGKANSIIPFTDDDYYLKIFLWGGPVGIGASIAGINSGSKYLPYALTYNAMIDEDLHFENNGFQSLVFKTYLRTYYPSGSGLITIDKGGNWFPDIKDHYLAIRFTGDDELFHYGWIRCSVESSSSRLVVKDYAYNAIPEQAVMAGIKTGTTISKEILNSNSPSIFSFNKQIFIQADKPATVSVFDSKSILVKQIETHDSETKIDMQFFPAGVYLVEIKNEIGGFYKIIHII